LIGVGVSSKVFRPDAARYLIGGVVVSGRKTCKRVEDLQIFRSYMQGCGKECKGKDLPTLVEIIVYGDDI